MAIEFECNQCLTTLRVADRNAGQNARCPHCQSIVAIPARTTSTEPPPLNNPGVGPPASLNPYAEGPNPYAKAPAGFSDSKTRAGHPATSDSSNPYAATSSSLESQASETYALNNARTQLRAAGICLIVVSLLLVGLMLIADLGALTSIAEKGLQSDDIVPLITINVMLLGQLLALAGGVCMVTHRNHSLAMVGSFAGMLSGVCCCIPVASGIYALVVLFNPSAAQVMNSSGG